MSVIKAVVSRMSVPFQALLAISVLPGAKHVLPSISSVHPPAFNYRCFTNRAQADNPSSLAHMPTFEVAKRAAFFLVFTKCIPSAFLTEREICLGKQLYHIS